MKSAENYMIEQLERLMALPLETNSDLKNWAAEGDKIVKTWRDEFPDFEPSDNFWHFNADPDIRMRDKAYLDYQHNLMRAYISRLRGQATA